MIPITDNEGLYPDGNQPPADYLAWGLELARTIEKVDQDGKPDPKGKQVVAFINGMSNFNAETRALIKLYRSTYGYGKHQSLINLNRGSWSLDRIVGDPNGYWHDARGGAMTRLTKANIHPMQVQAAVMKNSIRGLDLDKKGSADLMQRYWNEAIETTLEYLPNIKLIFMSSAMYSGYNTKPLPRKEWQAMFEGYGVKQLVEQHIDAFRQGERKVFVAWTWYAWANGDVARSDGLRWLRSDFAVDGVHPGPGALAKWSTNLLKFFEQNPLTRGWFVPK